MKKTLSRVMKLVGWVKAPKVAYLLRHPIKGPKNLLALRGAKSLLKTRKAKAAAAAATAAVATTAVAVPMAVKALKGDSDS